MAMKCGEFSFLGHTFAYEVKRVKYLRLKITENAEFRLSVPYNYSQSALESFLRKNEKWINARYDSILKARSELSGKVEFLGRIYRINFNSDFQKTRLNKAEILTKNERTLEEFLRKNALKIYKFYLKKWQPHFEKKIKRLSIKKMKTRWGSCNSKKCYMNLSLRLVGKPLAAIECVILHELTHLIYPHHRREFYEHLASLMPDYKRREKLLK